VFIIVLIIGGGVMLRWAFGEFNDESIPPSNVKCPKCGGSDYFMSTRNVMKGIGGIYGNRGGMQKFPVCKVCDKIMGYEKPILN